MPPGLTISGGANYQSGTHANRLLASPVNNALWKESDTGLLYIGSGAAWSVFSGRGQVLKTADETVNNSAVLQNDDHLFFPIEANEQWFVEALLFCQGASINADWQAGWTGPAGATALWNSYKSAEWVTLLTTGTVSPATAISGQVLWAAGAGIRTTHLAGLFTAAATPGTIQFQWAQNTATVEDNVLKAGSFLRLQRLA